MKPGTDDVVRTGAAGFLHAWVPLGGALLLAALVVAGGCGCGVTAWVLAGARGVSLGAAFAALVAHVYDGGPSSVTGPRRRRVPGGSAGVAQAGRDTVDGEQQGAGEQRVGFLAALGGRRAGGASSATWR